MKHTLLFAFVAAIIVSMAYAAPQDDNDETDIQEVNSILERVLKQTSQEDAEMQVQLQSHLSKMEQNDEAKLQGAAEVFAREQAPVRIQGWRDDAIKKLKEAGKKLLDIIF